MPPRKNGTVGNVQGSDAGGMRGIAVSSITNGVRLLKDHVGMPAREIDQVIARAKGETLRGHGADAPPAPKTGKGHGATTT